jgi:hypothetical protein
MSNDTCLLILPSGFEANTEIDSLLESVRASDLGHIEHLARVIAARLRLRQVG